MYEDKIEKAVANYYAATKVKSWGNNLSQDCVVLLIKEELRTPSVGLLYLGIMDKYKNIKPTKKHIARNIKYFIENAWQDFKLFDACPPNWIFIKTIAEYIAMNLLNEIA